MFARDTTSSLIPSVQLSLSQSLQGEFKGMFLCFKLQYPSVRTEKSFLFFLQTDLLLPFSCNLDLDVSASVLVGAPPWLFVSLFSWLWWLCLPPWPFLYLRLPSFVSGFGGFTMFCHFGSPLFSTLCICLPVWCPSPLISELLLGCGVGWDGGLWLLCVCRPVCWSLCYHLLLRIWAPILFPNLVLVHSFHSNRGLEC